jgi:transposase-like protein
MSDYETDALDVTLHDELKAREYFEAQRWPDGKPICPHCGSAKVHRLKDRPRRRGQIICNTCLQTFTVTVGTVMERSHVPLTKWAQAFRKMAANEKGISAKQIQRELKLGSYRTARFLCSRIREGVKLASFMGPRPTGGSGKTDVAGRAPRAAPPTPPNSCVISLRSEAHPSKRVNSLGLERLFPGDRSRLPAAGAVGIENGGGNLRVSIGSGPIMCDIVHTKPLDD